MHYMEWLVISSLLHCVPHAIVVNVHQSFGIIVRRWEACANGLPLPCEGCRAHVHGHNNEVVTFQRSAADCDTLSHCEAACHRGWTILALNDESLAFDDPPC